MKIVIRFLLLGIIFFPTLLLAKNYELPEDGIVIKKISCEEASNPRNGKDKYKLLSMLIYNTNNFTLKSKPLNLELIDEDGHRLFAHRFVLEMAPKTAAKEILAVPDCNDSFFKKEISYKFSI